MGSDMLLQPVGTIWPAGQHYWQSIVTVAYLVCIAVLAVMVSKRAPSLRNIRNASIVKLLVLGVLCDSFLFIFTSALLVLGVGTSFTGAACQLGIWWCLMLYATSKVFIYVFLMERVHLVFSHSISRKVTRLQSPWYRLSVFFFLCWIGVTITMAVGRISFIREHDQACIIGLKLYASVPMLAVDFIVNVYLTTAFVWSIRGAKFSKARRLAVRSTVAAGAALLTSFANIALLTAQHGKQLSWVCLGSCGLDVVFNAVIIFIITSGDSREDETTLKSTNRRGSVLPPNFSMSSGPTSPTSGITVHQESWTIDERDLSRPMPPTRRAARPNQYATPTKPIKVLLRDTKGSEKTAEVQPFVGVTSPDLQVEIEDMGDDSSPNSPSEKQYFM